MQPGVHPGKSPRSGSPAPGAGAARQALDAQPEAAGATGNRRAALHLDAQAAALGTFGAGPEGQGATQHVVQRGESLSRLSVRFAVSVSALKEANPDKLRRWGRIEGFNAGATITIPAPVPSSRSAAAETSAEEHAGFPYVVKRGETLSQLASKFGVAIAAIKEANPDRLRRWGRIEGFNAGDTIVVPAGGGRTGDGTRTSGGAHTGDGEPEQDRSREPGTGDAPDAAKPPWIPIAEGEIGQREIKGARHNPRVLEYHATTGRFSDDETPWCASFVNWVLLQAGQSGTGSARALSFRSYGEELDRPAYGSIAVFSWGGGKGHVGFVVGKQGDSLLVLGGNQGNQVKISAYNTGKIVAYVVPAGYQVAEAAYNLGGAADEVADGGGMADTR